jgi:hypothetical protein
MAICLRALRGFRIYDKESSTPYDTARHGLINWLGDVAYATSRHQCDEAVANGCVNIYRSEPIYAP